MHCELRKFLLPVFLCGTVFLSGCGKPINKEEPAKRVDDTPDFVLKGDTYAAATPDLPQAVQNDTYEDYDYAFSLTRPTDNWEFLIEDKARALSADAVAAVMNPVKVAYVVVIVERLKGSGIQDYENILMANYLEMGSDVLEREELVVDGKPAVSLDLQMLIEGIKFRYQLLVVQHGDFFYQVVGWTTWPRYPAVRSELIALTRSITFDRDRAPQVRKMGAAEDDQGNNWRIRDNVYENAAFGFRIRPNDQLRLAGRMEMANMSDDAELGLVGEDPAFYQLYIPEYLGTQNREQFLEQVLQSVNMEFGLTSMTEEPVMVKVGGVPAKQYHYSMVQDNVDFDFFGTMFFRGNFFYRVLSWWPIYDRETNLDRLAQSYQLVEWMEEEEKAEVRKDLAAKDVNNAVGPDFSLRNHVFRDFTYGYELPLPGTEWRCFTGDAADRINPAARLVASLDTEGLSLLVIPEYFNPKDGSFHEILLSAMDAPSPLTRTNRQGDAELTISAFDMVVDDLEMSFRLITTSRFRRHVQVLMSSMQDNAQVLDETANEIARTFRMMFPAGDKIDKKANYIQDNRVGYRVTRPKGWNIKTGRAGELEPWGSMVLLGDNDREHAAVILGLCVPFGMFDEDMAKEFLRRNSKIEWDTSTRRESETTLNGLPGRMISLSGRQGLKRVDLSLTFAARGNTMFLFLYIKPKGSKGEMQRIKESFRLME